MGLLERAHSYKDKIARGMHASAGLFTYPVLQAADILIYDTDVVPVGQGSEQHIEITRDLAVKINETYGEIFKLPEAAHPCRDRNRSRNRRPEDEQELRQHDRYFRRRKGNAKTRHEHRDRFKTGGSAKRPRRRLRYFSSFRFSASKEEVAEEMRERFQKGGTGYGDFKKQLFEKLWEYFSPMRKRREELLADKLYVDNVLVRGAAARKRSC